MSLPINLKFEVPRHKAPPPTKVPLWPTLTPPPRAKASTEPTDAPGANRPITNQSPAAPKAREARPAVVFTSPRRARTRGRRSLLVKVAFPGILLFSLLTFVNLGCATEKPKAHGSVLDVGPENASTATVVVPEKPAAYNGPTYSQPTYARPAYSTSTTPAATPAARPRSTPPTQAPPTYVSPPTAAEPVAVAPPRPVARTYVVQKGDTLSAIARAHYGDPNQWKKIAAANPSLNPDSLRLGQRLVIP